MTLGGRLSHSYAPCGRDDHGPDLVLLEGGLPPQNHLHEREHEGQRLARARHGLDADVLCVV